MGESVGRGGNVAHSYGGVGVRNVDDVMMGIRHDNVIRSNAIGKLHILLATAGNATVHAARTAAITATGIVDALARRIHVVVQAAAMTSSATLLLSLRVTTFAARLVLF